MGKIVFLNITRGDFLSKKIIHKHMGLEYALKTLDTHRLWFANPTKWKDPFEKRFIEAKYKQGNKYKDFPWKGRVYCMCFTQTTVSEAHWKMYANDQVAIGFQIYRKKLLAELRKLTSQFDIYIGQVEYMPTSDIKRALDKIPFKSPVPAKYSGEWYARLLLLKRNAFKYEDEIRIILVKTENGNNPDDGYELNYGCSNTRLIQSVLIAPQCTERITSILKGIFSKKYRFSDVNTPRGKRHRVMKSRLYSEVKPILLQ